MANVLTTNPMVLDTAGATSAVTQPLAIRAIKWDAPGAAAQVCAIHDAAGGNLIYQHTSEAANKGNDMAFPGRGLMVSGFYLTTLTAGKLLVYLA